MDCTLDTIRYDTVYLRALRSKADEMASLVKRTTQKGKIRKKLKQKLSSSKNKRSGQKSVKAVREEENYGRKK